MASEDIIDLILITTADMMIYMLPILAIMTGIVFITSFLLEVTLGAARKAFKG